MTIKLIALYRKPDDPDAFMRHYRETHLPLVLKTPHLQHAKIDEVISSPMGGEPAYYLIAQMSFPDQPSFDEAMRSPENRAAGKDLMAFAKDLATLMIVRET